MSGSQGLRWARSAALLLAVLALGGFVDVVPADGSAPVGMANLTAL